MHDDEARRIIEAERVSIVLPAGGGKTELIARAVRYSSEVGGRELILTHTHSGVAAIKKRLRRRRVSSKFFNVQTLDGFALRYSSHFPRLANFSGAQPEADEEWRTLRGGMTALLESPHLQRVIRATYSGVLVDEYQDCSRSQHELVLQLARILPTRILGDPLQSVFGFSKIVDWNLDVEPRFPELPVEEIAWRWKDSNPELGEELKDVRDKLIGGKSLDLRDYRQIRYRTLDARDQIKVCHEAAKDYSTVVAIRKWSHECHNFARKLNGRYSSMEELANNELHEICEKLDGMVGSKRAIALIEFARKCLVRLPSGISGACKLFMKGSQPRLTDGRKNLSAYQALVNVKENENWESVGCCLQELQQLERVFVSRRECWFGLQRALKILATEDSVSTLSEAADLIRERTRHRGRYPEPRTVSRVLLVKGLEYEHSILLDAEGLQSRQELYVALTRGSHAVTVLSTNPILSAERDSSSA